MKKRLFIFLIGLSLSSICFAQTEVQLLKIYGHLPSIPLKELEKAKVDIPREFPIERTCYHPDFPDRDIASADIKVLEKELGLDSEICQSIKQAHFRMLEAAGSGSWPFGCNSSLPKNHSATYYVDYDSFPAHYHRPVTEDEWKQLVAGGVWGSVAEAKARYDKGTLLKTALALMDEAYRRVGCIHVQVFTGPEGEHNIHIISKPIAGSVIGYAYFNNGTCGDHVNQVIDSTYKPGLIALARLLTHETGHNNNLQHEFTNQNRHRSIMSYAASEHFVGFSRGNDDSGLPEDASIPVLTRYYGGQPVGEEPNTPTEPTPPTNPNPPTNPGSGTEVGDTIYITLGGKQYEAVITKVTGDEGPTLANKVHESFKSIKDYEDKEKHREAIASILMAVEESVGNDFTMEQAKNAINFMIPIILADKAKEWEDITLIIKSVETKDGLSQVVDGLTKDKALSPEIIQLIKYLSTFVKDQRLRLLINIVLSVLEGMSKEEQSVLNPAEPKELESVPSIAN